MAAIDKIYLKNKDQYLKFKGWCAKQPPFVDKYGKTSKLIDYVYDYDDNWHDNAVVFKGPYYLDAYLIRNCPFDFIQKELMLNYGYWSQERIKSFYEDVKNWSGDSECPYWAKLEDFIVLEDGTMTIKGLKESDYEKIKAGKLYAKPTTDYTYEIGKHFRCIKSPVVKYNTPFGIKSWWIDLNVSDGMPYMWYHSEHNSWDFSDEFVVADWSSSTAHCRTIKALKRLMLKWKLPVGTIVRATGRYVNETYEFIITK